MSNIQKINYKSNFEIEDEKPRIKLGFQFQDFFETIEIYLTLVPELYKKMNSIPFELIKDDKNLGIIFLQDYNSIGFVNQFLDFIDDYDFKKYFIENLQEKVIFELNNFFEFYKQTILNNKFTIEGEIKRMKEIAFSNRNLG